MKEIFRIGDRVRIKDDYKEDVSPWRDDIGIIVGYESTDCLIKFPNGKVEPFGVWELKGKVA